MARRPSLGFWLGFVFNKYGKASRSCDGFFQLASFIGLARPLAWFVAFSPGLWPFRLWSQSEEKLMRFLR
jgi:hypothetical protein